MLTGQRRELMQDWDTVKIASDDVIKQRPGWDITKLNETTYQISGEGLGWHNGLIRGQWLYYTNTDTSEPSDEGAQALQRLLSGK